MAVTTEHGPYVNQSEVSQYITAYASRWIPLDMFSGPAAGDLADIIFDGSRDVEFLMHFNKGLSGASDDAIARSKKTSVNPVVFEAAALALMVARQEGKFTGVAGQTPDDAAAQGDASAVQEVMERLRRATPNSGSYANESDYFKPEWQESLYGTNYDKLLKIKNKYDPDNFFTSHHSVGSV